MSINGALHIGRSAIIASQAAIQVAGNNMANAATPGYTRRSVTLTPLHGEIVGRNQFVGRGVDLMSVHREVDVALQARYREALSNEYSTLMDQRYLAAIETIQNELTGNDVSSLLSEFFNAFSEVANNPDDDSVRSLAIQQGVNLASTLRAMRQDLSDVRAEVDRALGTSIDEANRLLDQIATVNNQIAQAESTAGEASSLRDQRDILIDELAQIVDIDTVEQSNGSIDVFIDSIPAVLAGESRGIELRKESQDGRSSISIRLAADGTLLNPTAGRIGGLLRQREETVQPAIDNLDTFTEHLIFQVNKLHSSGQGRVGFDSVTGTYLLDDTTVNLNSSLSGLPFQVSNGSFVVHVTNKATGTRESYQINVDGDADSLDDLINDINAATGGTNIIAAVNAGGAFTLTASSGYEISFSDDTSGALAALGVNTFFTGESANDIDLNGLIVDNSNYLAVGMGHVGGSNGAAIAIANLQDQKIADLGERSLREYWQAGVNNLAVRTDGANRAVESAALVRENLYTQIQAVSGVSLDEEAINLLQYQRQFQAAARFISVVDEALQTLLSIV